MEKEIVKKFDTKVQYLKYKVLREVAHAAWTNTLTETLPEIPKIIIWDKKPKIRCCIYKERAIVGERVKMATGGHREKPNVVEVMEIACDDCPASGYEVTSSCRGCLAHHCKDACKRGAITVGEDHVAHIDKSKCVECGMCSKACPYNAIINHKRPCQLACKMGAISMDEDQAALIDDSKCISCGACVYTCPFGAITDKSFILDVIALIKGSANNKKFKTYAIVAPAIASQFSYAKTGQVISGLKEMGFYSVVEAASGADEVALAETRELKEKGFLTTSCCPAFVTFIEKFYPDLAQYISHNPSPMAATAKFIKANDPTAKVVFVGPCIAKKAEAQKEGVREYVDAVISFEELQALFDGKEIDITDLPETTLDNASYFGRIFARSGGVTEAVAEAAKEQNFDMNVKTCVCNGIEECKIALLKKSKGVLDADFIEGMACIGGCIGGAGCLTHGGEKNKTLVDQYGATATKKTLSEEPKAD